MDYKIVLDSGHGGVDTGATGNGIIEKDLTLKISEYIFNRLKELGIPVTMTRTTDETLDPTERVNRILNAYGNNPNVIVVSNHINAGGGDGAEVLYALRNNDKLSNIILNNLKEAGQNVRGAKQRRLPSNPSKDYYFIHRNTPNTEAIIVEYGFLDSKGNDVSLLKNNYEDLAEAVVKSLAQYTNTNYTTTTKNTYTVQPGDTLWSISKKLGVSIDELKTLNNLSSNNLRIGQSLVVPTNEQPIPEETIDENIYSVKAGDTLYSIANTYNTTVSDLIEKNNLINNNLTIGQKLIIPDNEITQDYIEYTVKRGDNLYRISNQYGVSQKDIMNLNNLQTNLLSIGQILKIPTNTKQDTYTVQPGDTLYTIAKNYNVSVDEIKNKNNLTNNTISIGQVLKI